MLAGNVGVRLCRAVLRVDTVSAEIITEPLDLLLRADAVSAEKITAPLDLHVQGRQGCPPLLAGGLVAEQLLFPVP
jgi:hypothetical protein